MGIWLSLLSPSANSYDDYAQFRAVREGLAGSSRRFFSPIDFSPPPQLCRFPSSYHPLQTTFFFLEPIIFTNAKTCTDACFYIFAFETYKLFVLTVNKNRSNRRMNVSLRLTRIVLNPLENFLVPQWNIIQSWKNYSSFEERISRKSIIVILRYFYTNISTREKNESSIWKFNLTTIIINE